LPPEGEVWKELKRNDKNEYKSSLGGRRQKLIGAGASHDQADAAFFRGFSTIFLL
jgi:hypothetical protein